MNPAQLIAALAQLEQGEQHRFAELVRVFDEADAASRTDLLNHIAVDIDTESPRTLDLLLSIVDAHRLAVPAIRRLIANDEAVDEVAQDVLVAVAQSISSFAGRAAFRTWLNGVARNQARQHIRRQGRSRSLDEQAAAEAETMSPSMHISSLVARREVLESVLAELPDHYRTAVIMRDVEQCSYEEISQRLSVELNTVRSRISRGRALIASSIAA